MTRMTLRSSERSKAPRDLDPEPKIWIPRVNRSKPKTLEEVYLPIWDPEGADSTPAGKVAVSVMVPPVA